MQVRVNEFVERPTAKDLIQVDVLVESPTQRAIILGAGGSAIKRMATAARLDIEAFLGEYCAWLLPLRDLTNPASAKVIKQ
jgi:GTP-binding protein Era